MSKKGKSDRFFLGKIKDLSWWTFYGLFLLVVLLLLSLIIQSLIGGAFGRISNFGELIYFFGLMIAVIGLMGLCIAYIVRVMWHRLKTDRGGQIQRG